MKDRILQLMKSANLSNAEFAEKIGISTSSLSHIFSGRNNPSLDVVMRIHKSYPSVNLNWLLYGEGEMYGGVENSDADDNASAEASISISGFGLFDNMPENPEIPGNRQPVSDFSKNNASETGYSPSKIVERETVRYVERPQPQITEIRIFFDNGTYQVFKPENQK